MREFDTWGLALDAAVFATTRNGNPSIVVEQRGTLAHDPAQYVVVDQRDWESLVAKARRRTVPRIRRAVRVQDCTPDQTW